MRRTRYFVYKVKTKTGKTRTCVRLASSPSYAQKALGRVYKKAKKISVYKTAPQKIYQQRLRRI